MPATAIGCATEEGCGWGYRLAGTWVEAGGCVGGDGGGGGLIENIEVWFCWMMAMRQD